jgi:hypothetical protein
MTILFLRGGSFVGFAQGVRSITCDTNGQNFRIETLRFSIFAPVFSKYTHRGAIVFAHQKTISFSSNSIIFAMKTIKKMKSIRQSIAVILHIYTLPCPAITACFSGRSLLSPESAGRTG